MNNNSPERLPNTGRSATPKTTRATWTARKEAAKAAGLPEGFYVANSSQIKGLAWLGAGGEDLLDRVDLPPLGDLHIIFTTGDRWKYAGVPAFKAAGLMDAHSPGKFFAGEVKSHPAYIQTKLSAPKAPKAPKPKADEPAAE